MKTDIKKSLLILLVLFSCYNVHAQDQQSSGGNILSALDVASNTTPVDQATPTPTQQQTTDQQQQPTPTQTQQAATTQDQNKNNNNNNNNNPATTNAAATDTATAADNQATPTNNVDNTGTQNNNGNNVNTGANANTVINNTNNNQATPTDGSNTTNGDPASATQTDQQQQQHQQDNNSNNKIPTIAGAVVGGIVALASIVGVFTWLNRQDGGCASRRRRRSIPRDDEAQIDDFDTKMAENNNNSSPFQHARRFVPPTSGYMNLADEEYNGGYQDPMYNDYQQQKPYEQVHLDYAQPYGQEYLTTDNSAYYNTASTTLIASPTPLVATGSVVPAYHTPMKPDQVDQKPNAA